MLNGYPKNVFENRDFPPNGVINKLKLLYSKNRHTFSVQCKILFQSVCIYNKE